MDFGDTPDEAAFRAEVRGWIERRRGARCRAPSRWTCTSASTYFRALAADVHAAGYAGLSWPQEYGGRGASVDRARDLGRGDRPRRRARPAQRDRRGLRRPDDHRVRRPRTRSSASCRRSYAARRSGASCSPSPRRARTSPGCEAVAERVDGGWSITGQKVWTSRAQIADFAILLARTGADRHRGITYFLLPMDQPGVVVRPLRQITGEDEFNEIFLERRVRARRSPARRRRRRLADRAARRCSTSARRSRWAASTSSAGSTSWSSCSGPGPGRGRARPGRAAARRRRLDTRGRRPPADRAARADADGARRGAGPGVVGRQAVHVAVAGRSLRAARWSIQGLPGRYADESGDLGGAQRWQRRALWVRGMALAGGTPQIQRNIVAERVLGMPRG